MNGRRILIIFSIVVAGFALFAAGFYLSDIRARLTGSPETASRDASPTAQAPTAGSPASSSSATDSGSVTSGSIIDPTKRTPVVIYTTELSTTTTNNRSWPHVRVFMKRGNSAAEALVDIGGVDEYPHGFVKSPDGTELFINLESRLVALDFTTKKLRTVFVPQKEVRDLLFTPDGRTMYVWDQRYAGSDDHYFLHSVDLTTGASRVLTSGLAPHNYSFSLSALRANGTFALLQMAGEVSGLWTLDLKKGLSEVPGNHMGSFSPRGIYAFGEGGFVTDTCNDFSGSQPSAYDIIDPVSGRVVRHIAAPNGQAMQIMGFSPDSRELIYGTYTIDKPAHLKDCDWTKNVPKQFYRVVVDDAVGQPVPVQDYRAVMASWYPDDPGSAYFDAGYRKTSREASGSDVQYRLAYPPTGFVFEPSGKQEIVLNYTAP